MSYKDDITSRIKDAINDWVNRLKEQKPELHLTRQWKLVHDNGFVPGYFSIPVVTGSKTGRHLIGEVGFQISSDLELDLEDLEFIQKDEPYKGEKKVETIRPITEPLDLLNDILIGLNGFIANLSIPATPSIARIESPFDVKNVPLQVNPIRVRTQPMESQDINEVKLQLKHRTVLPEWLRTISNSDVHDKLLDKIAESYLQYRGDAGNQVTMQEFLEMYEKYLKREGKLYDFCVSYKAKSIELDDKGHCTEAYCSKKPFNKACEHAGLKFGSK